MENAKVVTISELIQRATPHTAGLGPGRRTSPSFRDPCDRSSRSSSSTPSSSASYKVLTPLEYPAILIGTLTLPDLTLKCPNKTCLQFSDESAAVCCDIICMELGIIGKRIKVHSWNFISFEHRGGGFLEILKWEFVDTTGEVLRCSSLVNSFPLVLGYRIHEFKDPKFSYRVHGVLETVSPVSVVPISARRSEAENSAKSRGFLVRILSCKCELCSSKMAVVDLVPSDCHSFTEPVFIYFHDFAWCWQQVLVKFVGFIITCSGLRRKTVFIGKESELMFVTTENSVLHLSGLLKKWRPISRNMGTGNGECGSYMGTISGMYLHGMVMELDKEVWLLLTDQLLCLPHSLRVGAIIAARNVHIVNPKFAWRKMLILGTCFKSSITVQSFSPLESGCLLVSQSDSLLEKFISSLAFSARFWMLLLVACFRKTLSGILSEKEILGSKHHAGLAQTYASSNLSSSAFRARHGVFTELYRHESTCCRNEPCHCGLKPAVPISLFIYQCESIWVRALKCGNTKSLTNEVRVFPHSNRMTFQSDRIGVTLIGRLKVSSSGRLQLFDLTGTIDAIVPDLPVTWNHNSIVQVTDYTVFIEGIYSQARHSGLLDAEPLSCRNIFHFLPSGRTSNVAIFVRFHLMSAKDRNYPFHPSLESEEDNSELRNGAFHIIQVVHKFLPSQKFKGISKTSKSSSLFIEAILLPWDLFLAAGDGFVDSDLASIIQQNRTGRSYRSYSTKRHKINHSSSGSSADYPVDNYCNIDSEMSCFCSCREPCGKERCISMIFPHEVSCLASVRDDKSHRKTTPDQLYCRKAVLKFDFDGKTNTRKTLLEFDRVNNFKYQIGNYYIIKHDEEDPFCRKNKQCDCNGISSAKVIVTSKTFAWSVSFSLHRSSPSNPFVGNDQPFLGNQTEVHQDRLINQAITHSDVCLHVPAQLLGFIESNFKELHMSFEKYCNFSSCVNNDMAVFLTCSPNSNLLLHDGTLTSLCGDVTAVHSFDQGFDDASSYIMHFKSHGASRLCIHVSVTNHAVCIVGFLAEDLYPTGFGPGIRATFHRILELWDEKILLLTPASYIVVNSLTLVNEVNTENCSSSCFASDSNCDDWQHAVSPGLISDLIQQLDGNPKQLCCRVVAITFLVLEKSNKELDKLESKLCSRPMIVNIPLAGFILDDGSASSCAWADGERAAKLLRLHEQCSDTALENNGCTFRWMLSEGDASNTAMSHLLRILKIHGRIIVRNFGSVVESPQDLTISVGSGQALAACDENLVQSVIFSACSNTLWTVVAGIIDPNAEFFLEKENVMETEASECSRGRIWVREVGSVNQLFEARNLVAELKSG